MEGLNKLLLVIGLSVIVSSGLTLTTAATAATSNKAKTTTSFETDTGVNFIADQKPVNPVNPLDPDPNKPVKPIDPSKPDRPVKPGTSGALTIDFASWFDFGTQIISDKDQKYYATAQYFSAGVSDTRVGYPSYVQVTDKRYNSSGWTLTVMQNHQLATMDNQELTGAEIKILRSTANSDKVGVTAPYIHNLASGLVPTVETVVMAAKKDAGLGTWVDVFGAEADINQKTKENQAVLLDVPGTSAKRAKAYSAALVWKLSDVPGNE